MSTKEENAKRTKQGNIVNFKDLDNKIQTILEKAVAAREQAYCPYSNFKVGSCIETHDGQLFTGCNVENASFTVGLCAERCAYVKAISEGIKKMKNVAVIAHQDKYYTTPCGACRQFMSEFGNVKVYIAKPQLEEVLVLDLINDLLPYSFKVDAFKF